MTNKPEEGPHVPDTVALLEAQAREIAEKDARIAELEAENAKLRTALKPFADKADKAEGPFETPYPADYPLWRAARAALGEKE
jgi:hypothetical protein